MIEAFFKSVEIHGLDDGMAQVFEHARFVGNSVSAVGEEYRRLPSLPQPYEQALKHAKALSKKHGATLIDYVALNSTVKFDETENKQVAV